jgi:hypothetical protein
MAVPGRRLLTDALKDMLETATGNPVGVTRIPQDINGTHVERPYSIIFPMKNSSYSGPAFCNVAADGYFSFQIKCVGSRPDQTEWLADKVREAILDRDATGAFVEPLTVADLTVMDRYPGLDSPGDLHDSGNIFEVDDTFIIAVTTS